MLSHYFRRIKLLITVVTFLSTVTLIKVFWDSEPELLKNAKIKQSSLKQKTSGVEYRNSDISEIVKHYASPVRTNNGNKLTIIQNVPHDRHSTYGLATTLEKQEGRCRLNWIFPYINNTHYENNPAKLNKIPSKHVKVDPIFGNPTIKLHKDRFLYPVGRWGPNNQMFGFFEAMFVSVMLNRTFVLPRFIKHHLDKQRHSTQFTSPSQYVDVEYYCRFISCITLESFQKTCGFQIDAILNTKYLKSSNFNDIQRNVGMHFPPELSDFSDILLLANGTSKDKKELNFTPDELKKYFKSSARCVIYPYPILDLRTHNAKGDRVKLQSSLPSKPYYKARNLTFPAGLELFESILEHYRRPLFIRQIAESFIRNEINGKPFLSIHWRYYEGDFITESHCNNQELNKKICDRARSFTVEDFKNKIKEKLDFIKNKGFKISYIYFAAPPDGLKMIEEVSKTLRQKLGLNTLLSNDLIKFVKAKYKDCEFLLKHFNDIISTTEMEICSRGFTFLGSQGTTWTSNVHKSRSFGNISGIRTDFDELVFKSTLKD